MKQVGGPARPIKDNLSNAKLRAGMATAEPLLPPTVGRQSTHGAAASVGYGARARQNRVEWLKIGHTYEANGRLLFTNQGIADFGSSVTMAQIFALPGNSFCHK